MGENMLLKLVVLADANIGLGGVDVDAPPPAATCFPKKSVAKVEDEFDVELPKAADVVPNGEGLTGSFEPGAVPKTDTDTADFFDSSAARTLDTEAPSVAPRGA